MQGGRIVWIAVASFCLFLIGSWQLPFLGPDEPRYSQIARQMVESSDYIVPHLGQNAWFEKPVLLYWLMGASYHLFGVNEFAARLPSALSALGCVLLIYLTVRRWSDSFRAFLCSGVLATTAFFIGFSHAATFDMLLTLCITASLCFFLLYEKNRQPRNLYAMYLFCGLGILAKGFVAIVLAGLPVLLYLLISRESRRILEMKPVQGLLIVLAVAAIWFVPVTMIYGMRFWDEFFLQHQVMRYTSSQFHRSQGPFFYIPILIAGTYPWTLSPFLRFESENLKLKQFGLCWLLTIFIFFSCSRSKLPGYILPAIPGFAIIAGITIADFIKHSASHLRAVFLFLAVHLMLIGGLIWGKGKYQVPGIEINFFCGVILALSLLTAWLFFQKKYKMALLLQPAALIAGILIFLFRLFGEMHWEESRILSLKVSPKLSAEYKLVMYNVYDFAPVFYTNAQVDLTPEGYLYTITDYKQLHRYLKDAGEGFFMIGTEELQWISEASYWKVLDVIQGHDRSIVHLRIK